MEKTIAVLNQMVRDGLVPRYAIGGGIGALFYIEPFETHDLDVFIDAPRSGNVVTLEPVHEYLRERDPHALLGRVLAAKRRRRLRLARLPIEEKLAILISLQRLGNEIRRSCGRPTLPEWRI